MATPAKSTPAARPYMRNGVVLQSPPLVVRARNFASEAYNFFGLYVTTLFTFDAYTAAENSQFNLRNRQRSAQGYKPSPRASSGGGGGGGGNGGSGGGGGGGRKLGRVDDIRGPECKSCG